MHIRPFRVEAAFMRSKVKPWPFGNTLQSRQGGPQGNTRPPDMFRREGP
jgi:hypothetical protein